ncbi:MAG: hypothetical protein ABSB40_10185 [Nitrososphaeria archaeon]
MIKKTFYPIRSFQRVDIRRKSVATALADLMMHRVNPATQQTDVKAPHKEVW